MNAVVATNRPATNGPVTGSTPLRASEFLSFRLGNEEYAIDILKVQEIRGYEAPTRIASAPPWVRGVVNLRGVIVPIVDLRLKIGLPEIEYTPFTVVIILRLGGQSVGLVVDAVSDVVEMSAEQIKAAPELEVALERRFVTGIGTLGDRMIVVADVDRLTSGIGCACSGGGEAFAPPVFEE